MEIIGPSSSLSAGRRALRIGLEGHSMLQVTHTKVASGAGQNVILGAHGIAPWVMSRARGRIDFPEVLNRAIGATNTTAMRARCDVSADVMKANNADYALFLGVCNDTMENAPSRETTKDNILYAANAYKARGIPLIVTGDLPAGGAFTRTTNGLKNFNAVRRWLIEELPTLVPGTIAVDMFPQTAAWDTGLPLPALFDGDLLHINSKGYQMAYAEALWKVLDQLALSLYALTAYADEPYDATLNPKGNRIVNPMLTGDVSGVATGWTSALSGTGIGTMAKTDSKVVSGNQGWQQIALTGTPTVAGYVHALRRDPVVTNFEAGGIYKARCRLEIDSGMQNLRGCAMYLSLSDTDGGSNGYRGQSFYWASLGEVMDVTKAPFTGDNGFWLETPEIVIPPGLWTSGRFARLSMEVTFDAANVASAATVRWGNVQISKVN